MKSIINSLKILLSDFYFLSVILLSLSLFIFKFSSFDLPYFSDELWVYGPSFRKMGENFPSLIPTSLNVEEHWGHPLMFFFIGSIWCSVFGTSIISTHIFSAIISTFLLITIYQVVKNIFNKQLALYSVLVFAFQSIFLGQYNLVLPEIMLTLFMFISLYAYLYHKMLLYIVSTACLVLVKETGVLFVGSIILWHFIKNVVYEKNYKISLANIKIYIILGFPLLFLVYHVLMLNYFYGWYIMPERVNHFVFAWDIYYDRIRDTFHYVFIGQGRKSLTLVLFIVLILFNKRLKIWQRILLFVFVFSLIKVFFNYWKLPNIFPMIIVPICALALIKYLFWDNYKEDKEKGSFLGVATIFILLYILFSASQFDSLRYILCIIPMVIIVVLFVVSESLKNQKRWLLLVISFVVIANSIVYIFNDDNFGDDTLNYKDVCLVNKEAVNYLESKDYYNKHIKTSFLFKYQLTDYRAGYLSSKMNFNSVTTYKNIEYQLDESIYIFCNTDLPDFYNGIKHDSNFELESKFIKEKIWVEVYVPRR